ncbi:unnamed protein product [Prorocentrum cordatum]|uniref:Uncharacterized protein n=1 Tax=Prorocentrum cordatum TaxID=2364126 RepID=A0ABN9PJV6_9DINO|nr:unnamed protein product [Polarella glacialis]
MEKMGARPDSTLLPRADGAAPARAACRLEEEEGEEKDEEEGEEMEEAGSAVSPRSTTPTGVFCRGCASQPAPLGSGRGPGQRPLPRSDEGSPNAWRNVGTSSTSPRHARAGEGGRPGDVLEEDEEEDKAEEEEEQQQ